MMIVPLFSRKSKDLGPEALPILGDHATRIIKSSILYNIDKLQQVKKISAK
jgi:hypothetical protein